MSEDKVRKFIWDGHKFPHGFSTGDSDIDSHDWETTSQDQYQQQVIRILCYPDLLGKSKYKNLRPTLKEVEIYLDYLEPKFKFMYIRFLFSKLPASVEAFFICNILDAIHGPIREHKNE